MRSIFLSAFSFIKEKLLRVRNNKTPFRLLGKKKNLDSKKKQTLEVIASKNKRI
jgi:hypothetical protein